MLRVSRAGGLAALLALSLLGCDCDDGLDGDRRITLRVNAPEDPQDPIDETFAHPPKARATPPPARTAPREVTLELVSVPAGAALKVDDVFVGRAPLKIRRLPAEKGIRVVASSEGYLDAEATVRLDADRRIELKLGKAPDTDTTVVAAPAPAPVRVAAPTAPNDEEDYHLDDLKDPYAE